MLDRQLACNNRRCLDCLDFSTILCVALSRMNLRHPKKKIMSTCIAYDMFDLFTDFVEAVQEGRDARQTDVQVAHLQDERTPRRPLHHWPFHQLRHRDARSKRPIGRALDR